MENTTVNAGNLVLDATSFDNIAAMMNSQDKENLNVAFAVLENCNKKDSLVYLLLLKKDTKPKAEEWKTNAPETYKFLKNIGADPDKVITFKQGLNVLTAQKVPADDTQFYLKYFGNYIFESVKKMGYDFVEGVEVKLKVKEGVDASSK